MPKEMKLSGFPFDLLCLFGSQKIEHISV